MLDLGTFIAAPFAATVLGEFGADVIKIERPGTGDPLRRFGTPTEGGDTLCWISEARNKRSLTLDLSRPEGADILRRLVKQADVLCENFRPGTLEGWRLGFDDLIAENPALVMLRISGFGQTGPLHQRPGFARIAHAFGGLAHLTGMPDGPPLTPGSTSLADYISGLYGAVGILVALRAREQGGGQYIDLGLYEPVLRLLDDLVPAFARTGDVRGRQGVGAVHACPHGHFECNDGRWIAIACSSDKMFARFAAMIGRPDLALATRYGPVAARLAHREEIERIVADWAQSVSAADAVECCAAAGVPCTLIHTVADIFDDPQVRARGNLVQVKGASGEFTLADVVPKLSRTPGAAMSTGPALGAHSEEILRDLLDLGIGELSALREKGVI